MLVNFLGTFARYAIVFLTISTTVVHGLSHSPPLSRADDAQCILADIWPSGPGVTLQPQPVQNELREILDQIDPQRINAIITKLVSFGTRHTLSNQTDPVRGIGAARDWIASEMRTLAKAARHGTNVTITVPSYIQQPTGSILIVSTSSPVTTTPESRASTTTPTMRPARTMMRVV